MHDARDMPPTIPFWLGEAPARTAELSAEVGALRALLEPHLAAGDVTAARAAVIAAAAVSDEVAEQVVAYLGAGLAALGVLPTTAGSWSSASSTSRGRAARRALPLGGRINRALGLALRKRFCVSFDFELQAAANDDAVTIALGPHFTFPAGPTW